MPKGKKFNAAEKHFEKKCAEWCNHIKAVEDIRRKTEEENLKLIEENERLLAENDKLRVTNEELMKLYGLSDSDVRTLVNTRKTWNDLSSMVGSMINRMV
jgi:hypothetical protein